MCILTLSYNTPIVARPTGNAYTIARGNSYWTSRCNFRYEKVEYRKAVWLELAEFVLNHPGCSAQEIRDYMGWGLNSSRNHCDYFSTMIHDGVLQRDGRKYWLGYNFANKVRGYLNNIDAKLAEMNVPEKCKRMTADEYEQSIKRKAVRELKAQIRREAK